MSCQYLARPATLLYRQTAAKKWADSPLRRALLWWRQQLLACVPKRWETYLLSMGRRVYVLWPIEQPRPQSQSVTLVLPAREVLACSLNLPWNAAYNLRDVVGFELDKYTPFSADQVYFDVLPGLIIKGQPIPVTLWAVPRQRLAAILQQASDGGVSVNRVDVAGATQLPAGINLLPNTANAFAPRMNRMKVIACAAIVVLSVALGLSVVATRETRLEVMREQVKQLRLQAQQVEAMRQKLQARQDAEATLRHSTIGEKAAVGLLNNLTRCLDSGTWIEQLNVEANGEIRLSGFSRQASDLPATLMGCAELDKATFLGSVQADRATGTERFTVVAQRRTDGGQP